MPKGGTDSELLADLVLKDSKPQSSGADLVVEPPKDSDSDQFGEEFAKTLSETESAILDLNRSDDKTFSDSWKRSREVVANFQPVPWFIWRLVSFVFSRSNEEGCLPEGLVLGLRRLLFAAASDQFLGEGAKVNNVKQALEVLPPDLIAAVSVIHATCRRLNTFQFDRIWRPIIDDAVLRAQIGFLVGQGHDSFGPGRGMLAGFAGRCGLAILIASGNLEQARNYLEMLAAGADINKVGLKLYGCDPLQVGAMSLSVSGCGRDAAFGTVQYGLETSIEYKIHTVQNEEQLRWFSAFTVIELTRMGREREIIDPIWVALGFQDAQSRAELAQAVRTLIRRGHSLPWIV